MGRLIKRQTDPAVQTGRPACLPRNFVTDAEHQSPRSCFSTRCIPNNIVLYVFDEHVVFEGQMSSQRSTRAKSAASFYYCTYLASLEWQYLKRFLKYMAQNTPTNLYCSRASFGCAYMHHIEKYVFQQESAAPGLGLLLSILCHRCRAPKFPAVFFNTIFPDKHCFICV